jgi:hypothetical protein
MDTIKHFPKWGVIFVFMCLLVSAAMADRPVNDRRTDRSEPDDSYADAESMQRPLLGFVFASDVSEIRTIFGIPGASIFGNPLVLPFDDAGVYFAPGENYAMVAQGNGAPLAILELAGKNQNLIRDIPGAVSNPEIVSFSPNGLSVAVYSSSEGLLQVIGGLPDEPRLVREVTDRELPDDVRFLALADDASTLLQGGIRDAAYHLAGDGSVRFLHQANSLAAMVFAPGSRDVLIYDRFDGTALLLPDVLGTAAPIPLISGLTNGDGRVALWIDSEKAVIASSNPDEIWQVDRKSLEAENLQLPAAPTMLQPLQISGKLLFSYEPGKPAWLLDVSGEVPTTHFIPAHTVGDAEFSSDRAPVRQRSRTRQPARNLPARQQNY